MEITQGLEKQVETHLIDKNTNTNESNLLSIMCGSPAEAETFKNKIIYG